MQSTRNVTEHEWAELKLGSHKGIFNGKVRDTSLRAKQSANTNQDWL